jgi:hypothetical protein
MKDLGELLNLFTFQTQFERQLATLVRHRACQRIDGDFVDQVRGFFRHFFDFHAAFGRGHEHHATGATVNNRAQVQLFAISVAASTRIWLTGWPFASV